MNTQAGRRLHTGNSITTRTLGLLGALALVVAACGSDGSAATSDPTLTENPPAADAAPSDDNISGTDEEAAPTSVVAGDIAVASTFDFELGEGTWEVTDGADVLGCGGGSLADDELAAAIERTLTCDAGPGSGTIVIRFTPEPTDSEATDFASDWTVHAATGDFAGLEGGGDWAGTFNGDRTAADETLTGSVEFGDPGDDADAGDDANADGEAGADDIELDGAALVGLVDRLEVPDDAEGLVAVSIIDADGVSISAADGNSPDGASLDSSDPVRIGSITKVFTALTTLTLVDDGSIALDDLVSEHVSRVDVAEGVTIRDLLQHTSGIPEHVDQGFGEDLFANHTRAWTPEEVVGRVAEIDVAFEAGEEFSYSNTNYIILGVLIEEVTGQPAHAVIRERVIDVVGMPTTYLDGVENGPAPVAAYGGLSGQPADLIDFDYTSVATAAWTAGSMVSSGDDLHDLFTALVAGEIISEELVAEMIANEHYGLGIEPWDADDSLIGHGGSIFGFATLVFHDPETGKTAFWVSTSERLTWHPIVEDTVMAMGS